MLQRSAKYYLLIVLMSCCLGLRVVGQEGMLRFDRAAVVSHCVGELRWNALPEAEGYRLYRHFPDEEGYGMIATLEDTHYVDTLYRTVCADTVRYYVAALGVTSDTAGLFYEDDIPTSPCALRLCTVDTALRRVRLSWYPSPDTDVMGYYICTGSPCRDYDTVWGRLNTAYLCADTVEQGGAASSFRVLAFDSCYQASPLTPYYHNPTLTLGAEPCSRHLYAEWNAYENMPDGVGCYRLCYRLGNEDSVRVVQVGAEGPYLFDTMVADLAVGSVYAWLEVHNTSDTLCATSRPCRFVFDYGDTARYLRIVEAVYDAARPCVTLQVEVDSGFGGEEVFLYRGLSDEGMVRLATLERGTAWQYSTYVDEDVSRAAERYVYRLGTMDLCQQWEKYSDTVLVVLPQLQAPAAYLPNVVIYGHPVNGRFCPFFLDPLEQGYALDVFDRMGQHVFHSADLHDCWDGTAQGRPLPQGTYAYRIVCRHTDGSEKVYHGTVTLIK